MPKVCIFDDDGVVLKILTKCLEEAEYEVVARKDCSDAEEVLKVKSPIAWSRI